MVLHGEHASSTIIGVPTTSETKLARGFRSFTSHCVNGQETCQEIFGKELRLELPQQAINDLFSLTYEELRRLAYTVRRSDPSTTLNPTAMVHEVWLKLSNSPPAEAVSPMHFKRIAARAMRQLLVEAARRRKAGKRGGGLDKSVTIDFDDLTDQRCLPWDDLLALNSALDELERISPEQAMLVESRYFGGFEIAEMAAEAGVSEASIFRDLRAARAWLSLKLGDNSRV
jgi:RNA polymerase sigma-70 factor, ECF subfamily